MWRKCKRYGVMFHDFQHSVYHLGSLDAKCVMLGADAQIMFQDANQFLTLRFPICLHMQNVRARQSRVPIANLGILGKVD
jgi:hypothetical protein